MVHEGRHTGPSHCVVRDCLLTADCMSQDAKSEVHCLPGYNLLGTPKSGTTVLFAAMMQHPLIAPPHTKARRRCGRWPRAPTSQRRSTMVVCPEGEASRDRNLVRRRTSGASCGLRNGRGLRMVTSGGRARLGSLGQSGSSAHTFAQFTFHPFQATPALGKASRRTANPIFTAGAYLRKARKAPENWPLLAMGDYTPENFARWSACARHESSYRPQRLLKERMHATEQDKPSNPAGIQQQCPAHSSSRMLPAGSRAVRNQQFDKGIHWNWQPEHVTYPADWPASLVGRIVQPQATHAIVPGAKALARAPPPFLCARVHTTQCQPCADGAGGRFRAGAASPPAPRPPAAGNLP